MNNTLRVYNIYANGESMIHVKRKLKEGVARNEEDRSE